MSTPEALEEAPEWGLRDCAGSDSLKRKQIIDGAARVFLSQGFKGASMGEIARVAGVSKGTLYVYFENKEQLFEACIEEKRRTHAQILQEFDGSQPIDQELRRYGESLARLTSDPQLIMAMRTVIGIAEQMPEMGSRYYDMGPGWGIRRFAGFLDRRVASGVLTIPDTMLAAAQFTDLCQSNLIKPLLFGCSFTGDEREARMKAVVSAAVEVFLKAYRD